MRESGRLADSRHPAHHKRDKGGHRRWLLSTSSWDLEDATAGCEESAENERDVSERVTVTRYVSPITLAICQQPENSRSPREGVQLVSSVSSAPPVSYTCMCLECVFINTFNIIQCLNFN